MATVRRRQEANLLAGCAVAAVLGLIAFGLPAVDRALPASRPVPPGVPYDVGAGVSVRPPPGAQVDLTRTRPGTGSGTAVFLLGAVRYALTVRPYAGSLAEAAQAVRAKLTRTRGYQVNG